MSETNATAKSVDVRPEKLDDGLQELIDAYVSLRQTADIVNRHVESELNERGMTAPQYGILLNLATRGSMSLSDLGENIFRSNSTITSLIDRLEADGLVVREDHEQDRRITMATLTEQGLELFDGIRAPHRKYLADMMQCITQDERFLLIDYLGRIKTKIVEDICP
jgi:DNA-binding MarR family transcriptional regulator